MAKVKKYLDSGCTEYILLDDDRVIIQPKAKCDIKSVPEDFDKQFQEIAQSVKETIYTSKQAFKKVKVGEELKF
jgi:Mg-chelatase subunit ChlI